MTKKAILFVLLFLSLGLLWYKNTHQAEIASYLGDYYFKKNDMLKAQQFYEKAFELGANDTKQRDLYVNSIINSPMNTDSQEKLVKFIQLPSNDGAKLKAEYFLYDFKREIHRKYPGNYISQAPFNQKIIRWSKIPITYDFIKTGKEPAYFEREVENAFTEWEKATDHTLLFSRERKNPNIVISFNEINPADQDQKKYVVAYTIPNLENDKLQSTEIKFYLKEPDGEYFSPNQIYNTALHEIVHAIGFMGHSYDRENIMYLSKDSASVLNDTRETLTKADIDTVILLYKIKPDITNTDKPEGEYIPPVVLGGKEDVNRAKTKEAKNYIRKAPSLPIGYIDLAESYAAKQEYSNAIKALEQAERLADTDDVKYIVYYNLGVVYYYIDHLELAKDYVNRAMEIQNTEELNYLIAEIYTKEKDYEKACAKYESLIAQDPKNIDYTINLTNIYITNHQYLKARQVLKNHIKNNPQDKNNPRFQAYGILRAFL